MSLLLASGHPDSPEYPVHRVWEEGQLVVERTNRMLSTQAILQQLAVSTGTTGSKSAAREFKKIIEELNDGAEG